MSGGFETKYNEILNAIAAELDIPPGKYKQAVERYTAVGDYLRSVRVDGIYGEPDIYPQGSFRLGTVVRPIRDAKEADYDIDLVSELKIIKSGINPGTIKRLVGDLLKDNGRYAPMLQREGRRCWTLEYAEQDGIGFHLDILPAIPENEDLIKAALDLGVESEYAGEAIAITDKGDNENYSWSPSNPKGYANWFDSRQRRIFNEVEVLQKSAIFENNSALFASIDAVPDQLVKTPLQRAIQILKRHRDMRFSGHEWEDDKPISMIITTLAAKLYNDESDLFLTLTNIVTLLNAHARLLELGHSIGEEFRKIRLIKRRADGTWYILNPVDPRENFADKWHENNQRKARAFFQWIAWLSVDLLKLPEKEDSNKTSIILGSFFGEDVVNRALSNIKSTSTVNLSSGERKSPPVEIKKTIRPWSIIG